MQIYMPFLIRLSHAKFHRLYSELVLLLKNNWQHVFVCVVLCFPMEKCVFVCKTRIVFSKSQLIIALKIHVSL